MGAFPEDLDLARRMAAREAAAWEEAVRRFTPLIRASVRYVFPQGEEDATEAVFLELLTREAKALRAYRDFAPLGAYLAVIARRVALRLREEEGRRPDLETLSRRLEREEGFGQEEKEALAAALAALPPGDRQLLLSPAADPKLAWRARERLRKIVKSRGSGGVSTHVPSDAPLPKR